MIWLVQFAATLGGRLSIVGGALAALFGAYQLTKYQGVNQERARVSAEAMKTDARAQPARREAERNHSKALERYIRD
jgi:hypothetical protein